MLIYSDQFNKTYTIGALNVVHPANKSMSGNVKVYELKDIVIDQS